MTSAPGTPRRHPCPCCGSLTRERAEPGTFDICPVCWWEDDALQAADPTWRGGANRESLEEGRANHRAFGAASRGAVGRVRHPREDERPA